MVASEYGWPEHRIRSMPLARIFLIFAAAQARHGGAASGPTFAEKAMIAELRKAQQAAKGNAHTF